MAKGANKDKINQNKEDAIIKTSRLSVKQEATYWERITIVLVFALLVVFPLLINQTLYIAITEAKYNYFIGITGVYLVCALVTACVVIIGPQERKNRFKSGIQRLTVPQILILAYVVWGVISALMSDYSFKACLRGQGRFEGVISMFMYAAVFFCVSFWGEYKDIYFKVLPFTAILLGIISVAQIWGATIIYPQGDNFATTAFLGTIGNIDCVSGVIATMLPVLVCTFIFIEERLSILCLPAAAVLMYIQNVIDVDGGKLGLMVAMIVACPFVFNNERSTSRGLVSLGAVALGGASASILSCVYDKENSEFNTVIHFGGKGLVLLILAVVLIAAGIMLKKSGIAFNADRVMITKRIYVIIGVLALFAVLVVFLYNGDNAILHEASELLHGRMSDDAGSGRGYIWKNAMKVIIDNPLIGYGPGCFVSAFGPYQAGWSELCGTQMIVDFAHNDFIQVAVCTGIVGLVLYVGFIATLAFRIIKNSNRFPRLVIIGSGMVGYLVYSFFTFSIAIVTPMFWVLAGLADKAVRQLPKDNK